MPTSAACWRARKAGSLSVKAEARTGRTRTRSAGAPRLAAVTPYRDDRPGQLLCLAAPLRLGACRARDGAATRPPRRTVEDRKPVSRAEAEAELAALHRLGARL